MAEDIIHDPGKFEGEWLPAPFVYDMDSDEDAGDVETTGYYALFRFSDGDRSKLAEQFPALKGEVGRLAGAIALEDSQGFVSFDWYKDKEEMEEAWDGIQKEVTRAEEGEAEDG